MAKKQARTSRASKPDRSIPGASRRSLLWRWRRVLFFFSVIVLASGVGVLWAASQVQLPTTNSIVDQTSFICAANVKKDCNASNAIASLHGDVNRVVVPLDEISPEMQNAVLAAEDKDFFRHGGVDPVGIARAAWIDISKGNTTHGGSTITQQYVKLTYLSSERTFERKIKEAILSIKLEQQISKSEIFERYLNLVYFGRGAYGVQAAAQSYFDVNADQLNLAQATFLAGIIRNPSWATDAAKAKSLRNVVLANMEDNGMISAAQQAAAAAAPLDAIEYQPSVGVNWLGGPWGSTGEDPYAARYFVQAVIEDLSDKLGTEELFNGGLRIYTTIDPERQKQAYEAVTSVLSFQDHPAGALVAIDSQGRVVAMMGGTDYSISKVNLATGAGGVGGRQVGSTFKAFALADLVKQGYSITSSVPAEFKMTFTADEYPILRGQPEGEYTVRSDCCASGSATVVDATAKSINSSFVKLMLELGPKHVVQTTHALGVSTDFEHKNGKDRYLPSYVLGAVGIPVVEVADAFSTFARNGVQMDAVLVNRVEDRSGNVLATYTSQRNQVLTPTQNARVVYALQQVIQRGTATSAQIGRPAAGKTGTVAEPDKITDNGVIAGRGNTDAWFTGFVPGFTTSVWMGYPGGNRVMPASFQGASYPAEIWKRFMTAVLAGTEPRDFPESDELSGGEFLTSWGGSRYISRAWDTEDYSRGVGSSAQGSSDSDGSSSGGQAPSATTQPSSETTSPDTTVPPPSVTAPPSTAPPPQTTAPPVTAPPTPPATGPATSAP